MKRIFLITINYIFELSTKDDFNIVIYKRLKNSWKVTYVWQWYSHILLLSYLFFFTSLSLQLSVMLCHNFYFIAHFLCLSLSLMLFSFFSSKVLFKQTPSYHKSTYMNIIRDLMLWEKKGKRKFFQWNGKKNYKKNFLYLQVFHQLELLFMLQEAQLLHVNFLCWIFKILLQKLALKILFNFFFDVNIFLKLKDWSCKCLNTCVILSRF